jgi:hypothetical protein
LGTAEKTGNEWPPFWAIQECHGLGQAKSSRIEYNKIHRQNKEQSAFLILFLPLMRGTYLRNALKNSNPHGALFSS